MPKPAKWADAVEGAGFQLLRALDETSHDLHEKEGVERDAASVLYLFMVADLKTREGQYLLWHLLHDHIEELARSKSQKVREAARYFIAAVADALIMLRVEVTYPLLEKLMDVTVAALGPKDKA